jgi:hypothetical protein
MAKFIQIASEALRWARLASKLFLILRHCSDELVLLYAISRAEILQETGKEVLITGDDKKEYVRNYLKANFLFRHKKVTELNRMIESAWRFKFHKEK